MHGVPDIGPAVGLLQRASIACGGPGGHPGKTSNLDRGAPGLQRELQRGGPLCIGDTSSAPPGGTTST